MLMHTKASVHEAATESIQYLENAAGDLGFEFDPNWYGLEEPERIQYEKLKADGVPDHMIADSMADWMFNSVDFCASMLGDHIFDWAHKISTEKIPHGSAFKMICKEILTIDKRSNIKQAVTRLLERH